MKNWVDWAIVGIILFYGVEGYAVGAIPALFDFIKFVVSFIVGLKTYGYIGDAVSKTFSLPAGISHALGFFIAAFITEALLQIFFSKPVKNAIQKSILRKPEYKQLNNILGIIPGSFSGIVLLMFLLTVIVALPVTPYLKDTISRSTFGSLLVSRSEYLEKQVGNVFGGAANETLNFLTVEPESNAMVQLHFTYDKGTPDTEAEQKMFQMVNNERVSRGLSALVFDTNLQKLAREHGQDMLQRGYFSHYTPEGLTPFDRMDKAGITYTAAGENLAFSPNTDLAMQGLMNSPGHKANILSKDFGKVGVGVINAGIYGEMFVQEFTN